MAPKRRKAGSQTIHLLLMVISSLLKGCDGFSFVPMAKQPTITHQRAMFHHYHLQLSNNDESEPTENPNDDTQPPKKDDSNTYSWAELQADPELSQLERQSSIQRKNAMLLPQRISQATGILAWTFVIVGIVLNTLGYAYVRDPGGGIGIGTLK